MIKYKTTNSKPYIEKVKVIKETYYFITLQETAKNGTKYCQRYRKMTDSYQFFDTFKEAKTHLVKRAIASADDAKRALDLIRSEISIMNGLREV